MPRPPCADVSWGGRLIFAQLCWRNSEGTLCLLRKHGLQCQRDGATGGQLRRAHANLLVAADARRAHVAAAARHGREDAAALGGPNGPLPFKVSPTSLHASESFMCTVLGNASTTTAFVVKSSDESRQWQSTAMAGCPVLAFQRTAMSTPICGHILPVGNVDAVRLATSRSIFGSALGRPHRARSGKVC